MRFGIECNDSTSPAALTERRSRSLRLPRIVDMTFTGYFLAQTTLPLDNVSLHGMSSVMREVTTVTGAAAAVTLLIVLWALYFRKKRKNHSHHHHHHHHSSQPEENLA